VVNYCPLAFLEATGRNRTPDKLLPAEKQVLFELCDAHLRAVVTLLKPEWVVAIGDFAATRAKANFENEAVRLGRILHPSPANPTANRDWSGRVTRQLQDLGVWSAA
jgi:single-strand selective monofunctional uracil DNA glycosylase